ncbi:MAG: single-stranded-DNA-specific exonuclease RecJ [Pelagibacteraceae bacterium]
MISVSGRKWEEKIVNSKFVEKIQQDYNFSHLLSKLIVSRNFDENEIYLIENNLNLLNIFKNNPDFINAVKLVLHTLKNKEKICILGDYDVDGSAATSLFVNFFQSLNHPFFFYIPDRVKDGYGGSKKLFEKLILKKPKLVIMVDCGSTSVDAVNYLNKNDIKSLIIDHHEIDKPYPKANIIINPKKNNGYLEYDYLCATALTYFFLDILIQKIEHKINLRKYLIYVLLATVCDIMPLRKFNRLISITALKEFKFTNNPVFEKLYKLNNKKNKININDLGYLVGPILNAGGRLSKSNYAAELLSSDNTYIINKRSTELIALNSKRKKIQNTILNNINFHKIEKNNKDLIIYYDSNINEGLIGIIASRLKDYFNKPSIVITNSNNLLKGSARSIENYNIGKAIKILRNKNILLNGGGHNMAAGFTLKKNNFDDFKRFIISDYLKKKSIRKDIFLYDAEISTYALNKDFYSDIKKLEPFGTGNPNPIFLFKDFKVIKINILKEKYLSIILKSKLGYTIKSIYFDSSNNKIRDYLLNYKKTFNVLGQINENIWNNKKDLQLIIQDLII